VDVTEGYTFPVARFNKETTIQTHWGTGERGGTDLFGRRGTAIMSVSDGTVQYATYSETGGNCVSIKGDDGRIYYYAHMDKKPLVRRGQEVSAGQKIGVMGDSGNAKGKGVHLHIGIGDKIRIGRGASGGCGTNFDAVTFLQQLLDAS
jgi:peptidoglycan LD-endopeptidase LytH